MAITSNRITAFEKIHNRLVKGRGEEMKAAFKKMLLAAFTHAVKISPVDSGLYRASHVISFNAPDPYAGGDTLMDEGEYKDVQEILTRELEKIAKLRKLPPSGAYLQNNLVYAEAIEHGTSDQAPQGVYEQVEQILNNQIENYA